MPGLFIVANNAAWNIERYDQEVNYGGRVVGTSCSTPTMPPWPAPSACTASGSRPRSSRPAIERALANGPALIDVVVTPEAVSSDARKGLGFVPDYQPLTAWDEAERKRRAS